MAGPKVEVRVSETPQSAGISQSTGTAFVVGAASFGPETPTLVRSLSEAQAIYGPRTETESLKLYDWLNTFFTLGGQRAYVNRALGAGIAVAKTELETAAQTKMLIVEAKYKGTYGNKFSIQVLSTGALVIYNENGEILEQSPAAPNTSNVFEYFKGRETYVIVREGSNYGLGKTEQLKVLAKEELGTGAKGVNPTVTKATTITAIEGFGKSLGPGTVAAPVATFGVEESVHTALGEHAQKNNRLAACDLKEAEKANTTVATLTGEKGTYSVGIAGYMIFTASTCVVQGVTLNTTRTVLSSSVVAALRAQVSKTGNDNQAPCGETFPLSPYVTGFTNPYKQTEIEELSTAGINAFNTVNGIPCLYGFVTALSKEKDLIFWQASPSAERMSLAFKSEVIGGKFLFKTIDGRHILISKFAAALSGMLLEQWKENALFGETAPEAYAVNVGEPVNTPTTIQNGELNAELVVRLAPYANVVSIIIVSTPITETV